MARSGCGTLRSRGEDGEGVCIDNNHLWALTLSGDVELGLLIADMCSPWYEFAGLDDQGPQNPTFHMSWWATCVRKFPKKEGSEMLKNQSLQVETGSLILLIYPALQSPSALLRSPDESV